MGAARAASRGPGARSAKGMRANVSRRWRPTFHVADSRPVRRPRGPVPKARGCERPRIAACGRRASARLTQPHGEAAVCAVAAAGAASRGPGARSAKGMRANVSRRWRPTFHVANSRPVRRLRGPVPKARGCERPRITACGRRATARDADFGTGKKKPAGRRLAGKGDLSAAGSIRAVPLAAAHRAGRSILLHVARFRQSRARR